MLLIDFVTSYFIQNNLLPILCTAYVGGWAGLGSQRLVRQRDRKHNMGAKPDDRCATYILNNTPYYYLRKLSVLSVLCVCVGASDKKGSATVMYSECLGVKGYFSVDHPTHFNKLW